MSIKYLLVGISYDKVTPYNGFTPISILGWEDGDMLLDYIERDGIMYARIERYSHEPDEEDDEDFLEKEPLDLVDMLNLDRIK